MSSKLQVDVCYNNQWWRRLVNAYEVETGTLYDVICCFARKAM